MMALATSLSLQMSTSSYAGSGPTCKEFCTKCECAVVILQLKIRKFTAPHNIWQNLRLWHWR